MESVKRIAALVILVLWASCAQADGLVVEPYAGGISYAFQADEAFVVLECKTNAESVQRTVYSQDGNFSGTIALLHTFDPSYVRLTVKRMNGFDIYSERRDTIAIQRTIPERNLPEENRASRLGGVMLTPMLHAVGYHFTAPGRASVLLHYHSSTQQGSMILYAGDDYVYDGILELPYTYHNSKRRLHGFGRKQLHRFV